MRAALALALLAGCAAPAPVATVVNRLPPTPAEPPAGDVQVPVVGVVRPPTAADLGAAAAGAPIVAVIETDQGTLRCRLMPRIAPATVANFIGLATGAKAWRHPETGEVRRGAPFYDGLTFHRVIPGFMVQAGDPLGVGRGGPGYRFADEVDESTRFDRPGVLAMANAGPDTNGSQFFVTEQAVPHLDGKSTIFGVCEPVEVVARIARVPVDGRARPLTPVTIVRIRFEHAPRLLAPAHPVGQDSRP